PRHLQQQFFQLIQAAQPVARDGIRQARAQHDELVLPLAFGSAHGAAHGAIEAPQLALGAAVHVAHAADDCVRLVVQLKPVADQLFELDLGRTFEAPVAAITTIAAASVAAVSAIAAGPVAARSAVSTRTIATWSAITTRTVPARSAITTR